MMAVNPANLEVRLATLIREMVAESEAGHCLRLDDVGIGQARAITSELNANSPDIDAYTLTSVATETVDIEPDRAVELRNRKRKPLILIVPSLEGQAASSLDNSFQRVPFVDLLQQLSKSLERELSQSAIAEHVRLLKQLVRKTTTVDAWTRLVAELLSDPTEEAFGRSLWRVGLVPDCGENPLVRLRTNAKAVQEIARSRRPTATINDRLVEAGVREGPMRSQLRAFFEGEASPISDNMRWARLLLDWTEGSLTFESWPLVEKIESDLDSVALKPFVDANDSLDSTCKLKKGEDGQLSCAVPDGGAGILVVKWNTQPPKSSAVESWLVEVVPPEDIRSEDTTPLGSIRVKGAGRRATIHVAVSEDDLEQGTRFVARLTGIGPNGDIVELSDKTVAQVDSQEFEVVTSIEAHSEGSRSGSASASLPQAVLRAAASGLDDRSEDMVAWDLAGQVFSVRLGNRRLVRIRISELLTQLQRTVTSSLTEGIYFSGATSLGRQLQFDGVTSTEFQLPKALADRRALVLKQIAAQDPRDTAESLVWTDELREAVSSYISTFKRTIESAAPELQADLLRLDSLTVSTRTAIGTATGVVVLPLHPLRLGWIASHDLALRNWSDDISQISPKSARSGAVDLELVGRVQPANLPFTVLSADGQPAAYREELTYGSALYLPLDEADPEAVIDALCRSLGIGRQSSQISALARLVSERVQAFENTHPGSSAVRILSVNPGTGGLLAQAIRSLISPGLGDDQPDPRRAELIAYTRNASSTQPLAPLQEIQRSLRLVSRDDPGSHLLPGLSLAVRDVATSAKDESPSHLAVIQGMGSPSLSAEANASDRVASFRDLLTPTVVQQVFENGSVVSTTMPILRAASPVDDLGRASAHRAHQAAMARQIGGTGGVPAIKVTLASDEIQRLKAMHNRADWVLTIDRYLSVGLYDDPSIKGMIDSYLLDYAPDFIEGIDERLTVTTSQRLEVEHLLSGALRELGLSAGADGMRDVLRTLSVVSGRLAMRLLTDSTLAREAVSLAALVMHLKRRGHLDGWIVIPVDAHPEIFGPAARVDGAAARRCDLLLVKVAQRSFRIECIEAKARKETVLPQVLADRIADQVTDTARLLASRFFATDPERVDGALQRARWAGLLHYYADRASMNGLIQEAKLADTHRYIERIEQEAEIPEITLRGYVIAAEGDRNFPKKHRGVSISVLSIEDLGEVGFTSQILEDGGAAASNTMTREPMESRVDDTRMSRDPSQSEAQTAPDHSAGSDSELANHSPAISEERSVHESDSESAGSIAEGSPSPIIGSAEVILGQDGNGREAGWRVSTTGSPHAFILGIPGQGKSVTTRKIVRDFSLQRLPALVIDFHGDMAADPPAHSQVLNAANGLPFSPFEIRNEGARPENTTAWEVAEIFERTCSLGEMQRNTIYEALSTCYRELGWGGADDGQRLPTMLEFADAVEAKEEGGRARNARSRIRPITDFGLFSDLPDQGFDPVSTGGMVVDLSQIGLEEVQGAAASFLLRKIYKDMFFWPKGAGMHLAVVLDEAHRLVKDATLPKMMKEGRKYGLSVVVASQGAEDFHRQILENAGTKIVFRTNFPGSKKVAGLLRGRDGQDLSQQIEQLGVGEAFVSTPDDVRARKVYMASQ